ncbi:Cytochrome P450 3A13-like protein [Leptotrombidium deliense]|uniref:Cytochrome P450 3A13-like protein n=1 Tax=Leptotrombidium deliense TaxID=299467 RepID=A0A443S9Z4_9ACAR|nr:Cytochrome P450 3A13-like protein [Leptotrombidium deliense]
MNRVSDNTLEKFSELAKRGVEVNVREVFGVHTFDTITTCTFGVSINSHDGSNKEVIKNLETFLDFSSWRWLVILLLPGFLQTKLGLQSTPDFILNYFETTMRAVLEDRKKRNEESNDILQLMLDAEAETRFVKGEEKGSFQALEAALSKMDDEGAVFKNMKFGEKKLSFTEILAQSVFLMLAGYHTTTVLLSYCSYALALYPEIDAKLVAELKRKIGDKKNIEYEDVSSLMYLDAFVNETLRYYPPITN